MRTDPTGKVWPGIREAVKKGGACPRELLDKHGSELRATIRAWLERKAASK